MARKKGNSRTSGLGLQRTSGKTRSFTNHFLLKQWLDDTVTRNLQKVKNTKFSLLSLSLQTNKMDKRNIVKVTSYRKQQLSSISDLQIFPIIFFREAERVVLPLILEVATFQGFLFFTENLTLINNYIMNSRFLSRIEIESEECR